MRVDRKALDKLKSRAIMEAEMMTKQINEGGDVNYITYLLDKRSLCEMFAREINKILGGKNDI